MQAMLALVASNLPVVARSCVLESEAVQLSLTTHSAR